METAESGRPSEVLLLCRSIRLWATQVQLVQSLQKRIHLQHCVQQSQHFAHPRVSNTSCIRNKVSCGACCIRMEFGTLQIITNE